jgi:hypothetical protein
VTKCSSLCAAWYNLKTNSAPTHYWIRCNEWHITGCPFTPNLPYVRRVERAQPIESLTSCCMYSTTSVSWRRNPGENTDFYKCVIANNWFMRWARRLCTSVPFITYVSCTFYGLRRCWVAWALFVGKNHFLVVSVLLVHVATVKIAMLNVPHFQPTPLIFHLF